MWHTGSYQAFPVRYGYITIFLGLILTAVVLNHAEPDPLRRSSRSAIAVVAVSYTHLDVYKRQLQPYAAAGIQTDHESVTFEEAREKLRAGLYVLIREGSGSKNLDAIVEGILREGLDTSRPVSYTHLWLSSASAP